MTINPPLLTKTPSHYEPCSLSQMIWQHFISKPSGQSLVNNVYSLLTRPGLSLKLCRFSEEEDFIVVHNTAFTPLKLEFKTISENHLVSQISGRCELTFDKNVASVREKTCVLLNCGAISTVAETIDLTISLEANSRIFILRLPHASGLTATQTKEEKASVKNVGYCANQAIIENIDKIEKKSCTCPHAKLYLFGKLCEIYAKIIDDRIENPGIGVDLDNNNLCVATVRKAESILKKNITSPPTLNSLVKIIGTNRNKLIKSFRSIHGMSIFEYCQNERMLLAQFMLENKAYSIAKIADSVGYKHPGNFSLAYKKHFGEPPKHTQKKSRL